MNLLTVKRSFSLTAAVISAGVVGGASAQHSDIEFEFHDGMIEILGSHSHDESEALVEDDHDDHDHDHGLIFESDFGDLGGGPYSTDDPGFGSETEEGLGIDPLAIIGFNAVGPLMYHDGTSFSATTATVTVTSTTGTAVGINSGTNSGSGLIGQADSIGDFHAHIDYSINEDALSGAYGIALSLSAFDENQNPNPVIEDSETFYIVFNLGLDNATFESAVEGFEAVIPEPTSAALLAGLGGLALIRRRKP
ncbi:MAG: PEP-CTERM sorting domain-containing protein [Planctomycetota bacterium]